jgi:1-deoxy-D-xylulose-5-phosphate reductoisomerase
VSGQGREYRSEVRARSGASRGSEPETSSSPREVTVLGSTGSIGRQAIAVAEQNPGRLRITGLAAGGGDVTRLAEQALSLGVRTVAVARATAAQDLQLAFYAAASKRGWARGEYALPEILAGPRAAEELAARPADVVLNGITGSIGLGPTLSALKAGRTVALANKESLVAGGDLVTAAAAPGQLVPVDSEHSALAQCLRGGARGEVARLVLTASGGPFRGRAADDLADVTVADALAHPTWDMGPVVTINSATLVNKGLELIEAHLLFGVPYADIDVVVHPQSIVHSMVTFADGATIAQASPPDMRLPIALALAWPDRLPVVQPALDWSTASTWEFAPLDEVAFPAVRLARLAGEAGGVVPALFNAANEEAVAAFVAGRLSFRGIVDLVARTLDDAPDLGAPTCVEDVLAAEKWAREHARGVISGGRN